MVKKKSQWERNYDNIVRAQERAKVLIKDLELNGLEVRGELKRLAEKPLTKSRYTKKQATNIVNLLKSNSIKSQAKPTKTTINMGSYYAHANIKNVPRFNESISVRKGHEAEDLAKHVMKSMKYNLTHRPSRDTGRAVGNILKSLGYKSKIGNELEALKKLDMKDFTKNFVDKYESNPSEIYDRINIFYRLGKSSPDAFKAKQKIDLAQSKNVFGQNTNMPSGSIDQLYDFFENSRVWSVFRKTYRPSDDMDVYDNLEKLSGLLVDKTVTVGEVDNLLMSNSDFGKVIEKLLEDIIVNN